MKNVIKLSGLAALIATIAFNALFITSCPSGAGASGGNYVEVDGGSGTFTLTGIPETYNGMYAMLKVNQVIGAKSVNLPTITLVQITNGSVTLPLWVKTQSDGIKIFSGAYLRGVTIGIYNSGTVYESSTPMATHFFSQIDLSNDSTTEWYRGYDMEVNL